MKHLVGYPVRGRGRPFVSYSNPKFWPFWRAWEFIGSNLREGMMHSTSNWGPFRIPSQSDPIETS